MTKSLHILNTFRVCLLLLLGAACPALGQTIKGNVYGGGEMAKVEGSTNVAINNGQLSGDIFGGGEGVLNGDGTVKASADVSVSTHVTINGGEYAVESDLINDKPFKERYNIYGGGNVASQVGETHVYVRRGMISNTSAGGSDFLDNDNPEGIAYAYYREGQMYFSVFGGGYGKNTSVLGNTWVDFTVEGMTDIRSTAIEDDLLEYQSYLDVIGGGFNGTVAGNTNVHVGGNAMCRNVYGGGLYAAIGTENDDAKGKTNVHITGGNIDNVYGGGVMGDIMTSTNVNIGLHEALSFDGHDYDVENDKVTILMSVFGGNDVSGRVELSNVNHHGGKVNQNLYGAGNGNYRGYYTPGVCDFAEGDNDNYYPVDHSGDTSADGKGTKGPKGNTYKGRPQTGSVSITIAGNSTTDKALVLGQVFGGGNSCTIGNWDTDLLAPEGMYHGDPHLVRDDPEYFLGGGSLNITIGSHVKIGRSHKELVDADDEEYLNKEGENVSGLFMGCSGKFLATQSTAEDDYTYHHYYDLYTAKYWPGFAVYQDDGSTLLSREEGLRSFNAYLNNILVWSDDVTLSIADDAEDIWLANFVGGGFRGSMKAKTAAGRFAYTLPEGVTIGNAVVGGAYNTDVVYRIFETNDGHTYTEIDGHYQYLTNDAGLQIVDGEHPNGDYHHIEYAEDGETISSIIRFYYDGGMLAENNEGNRIHQVHADPRADEAEYATSYFEPLTEGDDIEDDATQAKLFTRNKNKAFVYLNLRCALEPEVSLNAGGSHYVHGGNVFGGCFMSGLVQGDSWIDYGAWLSTNSTDPYYFDKTNNMHIYDEAADLVRNNALNVFGAGYGENTHTAGDTYLYIKAVAQDAGGDGDKNGKFPYMFNAFGGSYAGRVYGNTNVYFAVGKQGTLLGSLYGGGFKGDIDGNTFVELAEGFVTNVYGGSRQADIYGASHVWAYDGKSRGIADANHLIICNLYGGNDIAGTISGMMPATFTATKWDAAPADPGIPRESLAGKQFNSYVEISADDNSANRGFPLIGSAYAGGNGVNWNIELGAQPVIEHALLEIDGGSTLRAFGGGNMATVTGDTFIFTNASSTEFANVTFSAYQTNIMKKVFFNGVTSGYEWEDTTLKMDEFHVASLFGGNNLAAMDIQPTWNLNSGHIGNVYSGGNMGNMTYYNPDAGSGGHENERHGLSVSVTSPDIYINNLFGGCRMADVDAQIDMEGPDNSDRYGANVFITDGHIENVYGGNDVGGTVRNGTHVYINGAISGNVYGAGNGDYVYVYDTSDAPVEHMTEKYDSEAGYTYYLVPPVLPAATTDVEKVRHINSLRPNVPRSHLHLEGTDTRQAYVKGDVYAGGNSASVTVADDEHIDVRFNIGSYVTLNGVYLGSNGANLTKTSYLDNFFEKNSFSSVSPELLDEVMKAVDLTAIPKGFDNFGDRELVNANIGVFCLGGNAGSMTTQKHITMDFPAGLTIYNRIVGGCNNTDFTYKGVTHYGGFTGVLADDQGDTKVTLNVGCQFAPQYMQIDIDPETGMETTASLVYQLGSNGGNDVFSARRCNVYGGCFTSGRMLGGVEINVKSDMLGCVLNADGSSKQLGDTGKDGLRLLGNTNYLKYTSSKSQANIPYVFSVFGGGYGAGTTVDGDVHITLPYVTDDEDQVQHPRVNTIYGGSEQGLVVGNTTIEVRNGTVFNSIFGGSDAARLYGSSQIIVGYPDYYRCNTSGRYEFTRSDKSEDNLSLNSVDHDGRKIIRTYAYYREGDLIAQNVYETLSTDAQRNNFDLVDDVAPQWTDTRIKIGSGIYGGGFSSSYGAEQSAGTYTICSFTDSYKPDADAIGYGGNATIMVADDADEEHIVISERPAGVTNTSKNVLGEGGIFGCGHLVFTQGFKAADIKNYGYAEHTVENPLSLNTFQRLDLLTVRDCCLQLWGARDFAVNKVDAHAFSMARVIELNMQSSISPSSTYDGLDTPKARNYVCMMNNVYNFGALVTNDDFDSAPYHDETGAPAPGTYQSVKMDNINANRGYAERLAAFKQRNLGTARNLVGINNGYSLKIQNTYKQDEGGESFYYGPVIGVAEIKLLSHQQGEGGGYVYADNLHSYSGSDNERFLQQQGNLVFPGTIDDNYIVDDCFPTFYHTGQSPVDEAAAHYWFVEGTKYFFTTVLTGYTYRQEKSFHLDNEDGIVQISGLGEGQPLALESVWWKSAENNDTDGYTGDLRDGGKDYTFTIKVGNDAFSTSMPRVDTNITDKDREWGNPLTPADLDAAATYDSDQLPAFDLVLTDRVDNSTEDYYNDHMAKPEEVLIVMKGKDGLGKECAYYITTIIHYLQGPQVSGDLAIGNCALPGETIHVTDEDISVSGDAEMIINNLKWKLLPYHPATDSYSEPSDDDCIDLDEYVDGSRRNLYIPALYNQNGYKVAFTFQAMGEAFSYTGSDAEGSKLLVHNYHRMKDIVPHGLEASVVADARVYIYNEEDLTSFVEWINAGNTTEGVDFILQNDISLTSSLPALSQQFAGVFHGDGHHIDLAGHQQSLFGTHLTGKVYNLGLIGGASIATNDANIVNSYVYVPGDDFKYGKKAYDLSHAFNPTTDHSNYDDYVARYYANGDYQYARHTDAWSLRTAESPNYGSNDTYHDQDHPHDALRWKDTDADDTPDTNVPLYGEATVPVGVHAGVLPRGYNNDYLFFGQHLDRDNADAWPVSINPVAKGDADASKGGNRVYKSSGYYGSAVDDGFYYNTDAWALQPTLTAIDFTFRNGDEDNNTWTHVSGRHHEGDDTLADTPSQLSADDINQPATFSVDSNADYNLDGTLRSGSDAYDNGAYGHVTQNLLVICENAEENPSQTAILAAGLYTDDTPEASVRYHSMQLKNGAIHYYKIDNFHLVDKQDFNSPISCNIRNRAWYERKPTAWREADNYAASSAWEGLCIPLPYVTSVKGEKQTIDDTEYDNLLSHFYGKPTDAMIANPALNDRTLHHEYWLSGMIDIDTSGADPKASFAIPGSYYEYYDAPDIFKPELQWIDWTGYSYRNDYYRHLPAYSGWIDSRDDESDWYETEHVFASYPMVTRAIPYLVAFPGEDFYEFDLTDQTITFEGCPEEMRKDFYSIPVTDTETEQMRTTVGTHSHVGTYSHIAADATHLAIDNLGSAFSVATGQIFPFRTYMSTPASPSPRRFIIADAGATPDDEAREEQPDDRLAEPELSISGEGTTIVVKSTYDTVLRVYNTEGRLLRELNITAGTNRFTGFHPNVYIVGGKKLRLLP